MTPRVLDLFSGIGGFSLAAERAGLSVVAHCEIDPFPRAVLAHHWPETPIFPDVRDINAQTYHEKTGHLTADIICGGSPCQDLSTAGRQRGIAGGTRSGLFFQQVRIARELGARVVVWENVPGALSSNGGRDFREVIAAFTGWPSDGIEIPVDGWGGAGAFVARTPADYNVVYRVFDTRYFRVPQRRRRIFLVAHTGPQCLTQILFDPESLRGNPTAGPETGEDVAAYAESGFGGWGETDTAGTIKASNGARRGCAETLVAAFAAAGFGQYNGPSSNAATLPAKGGYRLSSGETFIVHATQDPVVGEDRAFCLGANSQQAVCIPVDLRNSTRAEDSKTAGSGIGREGGPSFALTRGATPAVCIPIDGRNAARADSDSFGKVCGENGGPSFTLAATGKIHGVATESIIRRLTPLECERLQAFPDNHTRIIFSEKPAADGPRYKACGNAITTVVGEWVLRRIVKFYPFAS